MLALFSWSFPWLASGSHLSWLLYLLTYHFSHSIIFLYKIFQAYLILFLQSPCYQWVLIPFMGEWYLENKPRCLVHSLLWVSMLLWPLGRAEVLNQGWFAPQGTYGNDWKLWLSLLRRCYCHLVGSSQECW